MNLLHKRWRRAGLVLFLALMLLISQFGGISLCAGSGTYGKTGFLNDRAADIIGSNPLLVPNIITPAGLSGKGQIVGIADSGLDKGSISDIHPDLQSEEGKMPRVAMLKSYSGRLVPDDPIGHGTHMGATISGSGKASDGKYRGIAPGASLYFQALLDKNGILTVPDNLKNLFLPAYDAGVRVHVNGWGTAPNHYSSRSAQIDDFVWQHPDFLPVFGAGNSGPVKASLTAEANSKNALSIGNSQLPRPALSLEAGFADRIADSSSRGPASDGRIKPELLAPGSSVVSACSSLTESNFAANSQYTLMGGSSMAAAVTAGALALLGEYLENQKGINNPSSALLKALLINGARTPAGFPSPELGFGIIDLASTILALQENQFIMHGDVLGGSILESSMMQYRDQLTDTSSPFKATLAWVDPPAQAGAAPVLVNNLDLVVRDPAGKTYYGNDFSGRGQGDSINNVEQIIIPEPTAGEYIIEINAANIAEKYATQEFSLVYGQVLKHDTVQSVNAANEVTLASGSHVNLSALKQTIAADGAKTTAGTKAVPGSDLYMTPSAVYSFSRTWGSGGVQILPWQEGNLLLEINAQIREGGFFIDSRLNSNGEELYLNDIPINGLDEIPAGIAVDAAINPSRQTVWQIKASYQEVKGFIEHINLEKKEIKILQDSKIYNIASRASVSFNDNQVDVSDVAAPFGSAETASLDKLAPGMKVNLFIAPSTGEVQYIKVDRQIVMGTVESIDLQQEQIGIDTGRTYQLFPGAMILKDNIPAELAAVKPGDKLMALLLTDTANIIQLNVITNMDLGRVVYFNSKTMDLYYWDRNNRFKNVRLNPHSKIFRAGIELNQAAFEPGDWIRLISSPDGKEVWRVDIAEVAQVMTKVFNSYDQENKTIITRDGYAYTYSSYSQLSNRGYSITPDLIRPGESIRITTLASPYPRQAFLAGVEVTSKSNVPTPELTADAYVFNGVLIITGKSSADRIILYRSDSGREEIQSGSEGSFSRIFPLLEDESEVKILALDSTTGGIKGIDLSIKDYPVASPETTLDDITDHPAREHIEKLVKQGVSRGYDDNTFRPQKDITRAEFICLLARSKGWKLEGNSEMEYFSDNSDIPWWALEAVYAAREKEVINGYPDGSFRPYAPISRSDMAVIIYNLTDEQIYEDKEINLAYEDRNAIPHWALTGFSYLYESRLLPFADDTRLQPNKPLTRGEAAVILAKLLR